MTDLINTPNLLAIDSESTIHAKGDPFSVRNKLCCISYHALGPRWDVANCVKWEYDGPASADSLYVIDGAIKNADLLIFFNAKRDLHWLRRCGIISSYDYRIWDCQLAQFIISHQQDRYPSLDRACENFRLGKKLDTIEDEYWNLGVDTPNVPWDILSDYAIHDAELTLKLYHAQQEYLRDKPALKQLIKISCMDTLILAEMEWNGIKYDIEESLRRSEQKEQEIRELEKQLRDVCNLDAQFNFNSNDHLSCLLYGGTYKYVESSPYEHTYKTGEKAGLTTTRYKHKKIEVTLPRLVQPLPKSELAKEGYWSTDDGVLKRLRASGVAKRVIGLITKRNELERLASTYYRGFPKIAAERDWPKNELHGQFNQCTVVTGRLSSSSPNLQNVSPEVDELIKTRYE